MKTFHVTFLLYFERKILTLGKESEKINKK